MFIILLSFSSSLATRCLSLNDEIRIVRSNFIGLNHVELKYYPFMISLYEFNGSCNSGNLLSPKICAPSKTKDINVKAFNMVKK